MITFTDEELHEHDLVGRNLFRYQFTNCSIINADLSNTDLSQASFKRCLFWHSDLSGAKIDTTVFDDKCSGFHTNNFGGMILLRHWKGDPINMFLFTSVLGGMTIKIHDYEWTSFEQARRHYNSNTTGKLRTNLLMIMNYLEAVLDQYNKNSY
jgi:uncharacterized protein YjbI with pentapeptide repeats